MSTKNVLVTGASGFIGGKLVARLVALGVNVRCFVRSTSDVTALKKLGCSIVIGDVVKDPEAVVKAVEGCDEVYHLAASTHAIRARDLLTINPTGLTNVLEACARCSSPPTLVFVSSLAATGPSQRSKPHQETDSLRPVSYYGRSKAECERIAHQFADRVPISIVRPPIVLGDGDRHGLEMFRTIEYLGWHFVPSFSTHDFSTIHVDDLATALISVAQSGKRLTSGSTSKGVYFASADETLTYSQLGRQIGAALGRKRTRVLRIAMPIFWTIAIFNEIKARVVSRPHFLNIDKCREANAGSWTCSNEKIKQEVGFAPATSLFERLRQTGNGYRQNGWLKKKKIASTTRTPQRVSGA